MTSSVWGRIKERFSCRYKPKQDWLGLTNLSPRHHYRWGKKRRRRNVCHVSSQMRLIVMGTPLLCLGSKSEGFAVCSWCSARKRASCGDTCVYVKAGHGKCVSWFCKLASTCPTRLHNNTSGCWFILGYMLDQTSNFSAWAKLNRRHCIRFTIFLDVLAQDKANTNLAQGFQ